MISFQTKHFRVTVQAFLLLGPVSREQGYQVKNECVTLWEDQFWQIISAKIGPPWTDIGKKVTIFCSQNQSGRTNFGSKSGLGGQVLAGFSAKIGPILEGPILV